MSQLFTTKSLETLQQEAASSEGGLRRALGPIGLTSIGVGAIIGAGIFVITGRVAALDAGPGIMLSFVVAGLACTLAALCYAEFASMAPVAGSAYTYAYATLGELLAWIIGWDLILEYAMSTAVVSAVWAKYLNSLLGVIATGLSMKPEMLQIPEYLCNDPFSHPGAWFNLPAVGIMALITMILVIGIRESSFTNTLLVVIKLGVVLLVIIVGASYVKPERWTTIPVTERILPGEGLTNTETRRQVLQEQSLVRAAQEWAKQQYGQDTKIVSVELSDGKTAHVPNPPPDLEKRISELQTMALAAYRINFAKQNNDESLLSAAEAKYGSELPKSERDKRAVTAILNVVQEGEPKAIAKKWGMLTNLGVTEKLTPIDDAVRNPFLPYGLSGVMLGAALVFFAYIGFDAVSTHAEEAKNPQVNVPIGILVSLGVCTLLYMCVAAVITGMVPYAQINQNAAVAEAFKTQSAAMGSSFLNVIAGLIALGALAGMTSVLLITFQSQARIFLAMARDGLLPTSVFGKVHPRFRTPYISTILVGVTVCVIAAFTPILILEEMVNIGTLLAFAIVCGAVLILRIRRPEANRPFKCPLVFVLAPLGILVNVTLMLFLPIETWMRLVIWLGLGLVIYCSFGYWNSSLRHRLASGGTA